MHAGSAMRPDLKKHAIVGGALGGAFSALGGYFAGPAEGAILGVAVAWVVGWLKEVLWDKYLGRGVYDPVDAQYTYQAGVIGAVLGTWVGYFLR